MVARWRNGLWYPGTVDDERDVSRHVTFDDGDEGWFGPQALTVETDTEDTADGKLAVGKKVRAQWGDGSWYKGKIDERFGRVWHITFDDGDQAWMDSSRMTPARFGCLRTLAISIVLLSCVLFLGFCVLSIVVPGQEQTQQQLSSSAPTTAARPQNQIYQLTPITGPVTTGMRVLAPATEHFSFLGTVESISPQGRATVLFFDGERASLPIQALGRDDIRPGSTIHSRSASEEGWYVGVVQERGQGTIRIAFENGSVETVPYSWVRVRTQ